MAIKCTERSQRDGERWGTATEAEFKSIQPQKTTGILGKDKIWTEVINSYVVLQISLEKVLPYLSVYWRGRKIHPKMTHSFYGLIHCRQGNTNCYVSWDRQIKPYMASVCIYCIYFSPNTYIQLFLWPFIKGQRYLRMSSTCEMPLTKQERSKMFHVSSKCWKQLYRILSKILSTDI